jgi:N-acetylmuramoyl-L-alanine amidase
MKPHVIAQGEYLTRLAAERGFDAAEVWNHPANRDLRARRPNPDILAPGDVVHLPDAPAPAGAPIQAGGTHRYRARVPRVTIRLLLQGCAGEPYEIRGLPGAAPRTGTVAGDGELRFEAPTFVREVDILLPQRRTVIPVRIGHLDPADEASGERARLTHLGHLTPPPSDLFRHPIARELDPTAEAAEERLSRARARFQEAQGLEPTGEASAATLQALRERHGS